MTTTNVGILGIGVYLPEQVRTNDWWPASLRAKWDEKARHFMPNRLPDGIALTDGVTLVLEAMAEANQDPFCGAKERRILPDDQLPSGMEANAAQDALARAALAPTEIDLLLGSTTVADHIGSPNACAVHARLGLSERCFTVAVENGCNSFLTQLTLAQHMLQSGAFHKALLLQSCNISRILPRDQPYSAWFGDAATAVVLGHVGPGYGILGAAHYTDGVAYDSLVASVPGHRWFDEGRVYWHPRNKEQSRRVVVLAADNGRQAVHQALQNAGSQLEEVDFYASHQPTKWFRRVTQQHIGIATARYVDTFSWTGSLSACNIPLELAIGEREGMLRSGDLVATYSGGMGMTWSSVILRWGCV